MYRLFFFLLFSLLCFKKEKNLLLFLNYVYVCECRYLRRPEEGMGCPGAGTTGVELPGVGAGNGTLVLCKSH